MLLTLKKLLAPYWHKINDQLMAGRRRKFYASILEPGDLCFDVGANVGNRTAAFLQAGARVVAIEPQPACVNQLKKRFGATITIISKGLGAEEGILPMHISDASTLSTFSNDWIQKMGNDRFAGYKWNDTIDVPVTTLDRVIGEYGLPKFCKIDVEGFELNVIKGLSHPIPFVSFEYAVPENMDNLVSVIDALVSISPTTVFNYSPLESMQFALPEYVDAPALRRLIRSDAFIKTGFGDIYARMNP